MLATYMAFLDDETVAGVVNRFRKPVVEESAAPAVGMVTNVIPLEGQTPQSGE